MSKNGRFFGAIYIPVVYKNEHFTYQDRLGTSIGKERSKAECRFFLSGPLLYTLDQIPLTPGPLVVVIKVASSQVQPNDNHNDNNNINNNNNDNRPRRYNLAPGLTS